MCLKCGEVLQSAIPCPSSEMAMEEVWVRCKNVSLTKLPGDAGACPTDADAKSLE